MSALSLGGETQVANTILNAAITRSGFKNFGSLMVEADGINAPRFNGDGKK
jgi:hypothetical protein